MSKRKILYRQGDVMIQRVGRLPKGATKAKDCVLAYGEATGHAHRVESGAAMFVTVDDVKYLHVLERATVVHQEHGPIVLDPGIYRVGIQREYVAPDLNRDVLD